MYVGEGDNVLARLLKHNRDDRRDYWTRTAVVTSKDENLTKSHVRYLESRLVERVRAAGRARLDNENEPPQPLLPESDRADMEFFLDQLQMVLPVLGFGFTQPLPTTPEVKTQTGGDGAPQFVMNPVGTSATAREVDGEFIVLKGSTARKLEVEGWAGYKALRSQLVAEGKLTNGGTDGFLVFTEDVPFTSPSAAAAVVYGGNQNGRIAWRTKDSGLTYREWQERKLAAAAPGPAEVPDEDDE